ncbi:unannotated protein [freshwater metagenome]|uniref:Unannotated protein n=1 Tax=freshwater metagenome TaxID=449393 RepID=A0A6J7C7S6_9ZZZZ
MVRRSDLDPLARRVQVELRVGRAGATAEPADVDVDDLPHQGRSLAAVRLGCAASVCRVDGGVGAGLDVHRPRVGGAAGVPRASAEARRPVGAHARGGAHQDACRVDCHLRCRSERIRRAVPQRPRCARAPATDPRRIHGGGRGQRARCCASAGCARQGLNDAGRAEVGPDARRTPRRDSGARRATGPGGGGSGGGRRGACTCGSAARGRHDSRAGHAVRRAARYDDAHRPGSAGDQGRASRWRPHPQHHPVPRVGWGEGDAG